MDKRKLLKIKIKSLAEEARIIRFEERRSRGVIRNDMHNHRVRDVRREARHSLLAYAFIRGKEYREAERTPKTAPDWKQVERMVLKYGGVQLPSEWWQTPKHK